MEDEAFDPSFECALLTDGSSKSVVADVLIKSSSFVSWLKTYKNKVAGVPSNDTYMPTYKTMKPEVQRIQALHDYATSIATSFSEQLGLLKGAEPGSDAFNTATTAAIRLLDIAVVVNFMKMFNSSIMNDFAMFKRSFHQIRSELPASEAETVANHSHALHFFLANPNSIIEGVKAAAEKEPSFEQSLSAILETIITALSNPPSPPPSVHEFNALLRAGVYCVYILDGQRCNAFKIKSVRNARNMVKMHPTIPVHGDLTLSALVVLKSSPHWEEGMEKDWTQGESEMCAIL